MIGEEFALSPEQRLAELGRDIVQAAYLRGHFILSSGQATSYYFDKYLFGTKPSILRRLASFLGALVPETADRVAGTELGGIALAAAVSLEIGLPYVIVRRQANGYAESRRFEGELYAGERVVLIEDVLTTGSQAIRAAQELSAGGALILGILGILDREEGAAENVAAAGFQLRTLFRRSDLGLT
ncbi:MAG: orotate phosphoribosyltransferase [Chloroflexi bacterium]|nr:orotate phosphoribosyltransferase [Chloroflexota bacterium]